MEDKRNPRRHPKWWLIEESKAAADQPPSAPPARSVGDLRRHRTVEETIEEGRAVVARQFPEMETAEPAHIESASDPQAPSVLVPSQPAATAAAVGKPRRPWWLWIAVAVFVLTVLLVLVELLGLRQPAEAPARAAEVERMADFPP